MSNPKVSILIPAWNAESLISHALDSTLAQTYSNIEIIVMNDGSTDNTWKVLQSYQQKHPQKIQIFSQENRGLGATRNALIKKATGDYIINLDADDWLEPDFVDIMLSTIGETGDIAICGLKRYDTQYQFRDQRTPGLSPYAKFRFCTTAGKMFRHDFLRRNKLQYKSMNMGEDTFFNIIAYSKTNAITVADYSGYCCYESQQSMSHTAKYDAAKSFYALMKTLTHELKDSPFIVDPDFHYYILKNLIMDIFVYKDNLSASDLIKIYRQSISWYQEFLRQNQSRLHFHFQKGEATTANLTINGFIFLTKSHLDRPALRILRQIPVRVL